MAQVCGGTSYDFNWDRKLGTALKRLRQAADRWAADGRGGLEPSRVASVILAIFSAGWSGFDFEDDRKDQIRSLARWLSVVQAPEIECRPLLPKADYPTVQCAVHSVVGVLEQAAISWSEGDPEDPPTEHVLNWMVGELHDLRARVRPPDPKLPPLPPSVKHETPSQ
jgi:hypothetical protein